MKLQFRKRSNGVPTMFVAMLHHPDFDKYDTSFLQQGTMAGAFCPEETSGDIDKEGWLHTGDLGEVDENGYFKVTGRIKDMIIRNVENIYPGELESFLYGHHLSDDSQRQDSEIYTKLLSNFKRLIYRA